MKRWVVSISLLVPVAPMAGCWGSASQDAASAATEKALEIHKEKRAEIRDQIMLKSRRPGRAGVAARPR